MNRVEIGMKVLSLLFLLTSFVVNGQSLADYQQVAIENNPMLKAKYKTFEANLTKVQQVNSLPDPSLSFGYFISPVETRVGPQKARFSLTQMFPWFGTLKAKGDLAALTAEASFQQFIDEQNRIKFNVAQAYFPLSEVEEVLVIQHENLEILQSWKRLATIQYESGKTSLADVLRIDLMVQELETELSLLDDQKLPLRVTFNRLLNRADTSSINLSGSLVTEPVFVAISDWSTHPKTLELNKQIEAKQMQLTVIEKQGRPNIGAGLDYVVVNERTDLPAGQAGANVPDNGKNAFMPMITVSLPIFRKKYQEAQRETELNIDSYQHSLVALENELSTQYEKLKYEIAREQQLFDLYERQITETRQIQNLLYTAFSDSGSDLDELLMIQQQLLNYSIKKAKSQTRLKTKIANMNYLLAVEQ